MKVENLNRRILSLFLSLVMIVGILPTNIFARAGSEPTKKSAPVLKGHDKKGTEIKNGGRKLDYQEQSVQASFKGISGRAFTMTGYDFSTAKNKDPLPDGTIIYLQWMDTDGVLSPIYSTKTYTTDRSELGWYSFGDELLQFYDANGKLHKIDYNTTSNQRFRLWAPEGQYSPAGNEYITARQAPGGSVGFYRWIESPGGAFVLAGANVSKTGVFVYERPKVELMMNDSNYKIDREGPLKMVEPSIGRPRNTISGAVWWETKEGGVGFPVSTGEPNVDQNSVDEGLKGIRVITSALTSEGAAAMRDLVVDTPASQRTQRMEKILKAHPNYILQTVESPVVMSSDGNIGRYAARFDEEINRDYLYQFVVGPNNEVLTVINKFPIPGFYGPWDYNGKAPIYEPITNGIYNVHNALVSNPYDSSIDITNFGMTKETSAAPGDTANIDVKATFLPGNDTKIVWVKSNGDVVQTTEVNSLEEAKKATYTVPSDLNTKEIYTVRLVINGAIVDADQFMADPVPKVKLHRNLNDTDNFVTTVSVNDIKDEKVTLTKLVDTKEYKQENKYFVGWSTNPKATQPDENALVDKSQLTQTSLKDIYLRDGDEYKLPQQGKSSDLYAVWKDPFTVKLSKTWLDENKGNLDAKGFDASKLKFGLISRPAVGTFGSEVVATLATYTPVKEAPAKVYNPNDPDGIEWTNLPSYDEKGRRISYLAVELVDEDMAQAYEDGDTTWSTYNINIVPAVTGENYIPPRKEQTVKSNGVDTFTAATHRVHLTKAGEKDPHPIGGSQTEKIGYFDTTGYKIDVTNTKIVVETPKIEQAKKGGQELKVTVENPVDKLKLEFNPISGKSSDPKQPNTEKVEVEATYSNGKWTLNPDNSGFTVDDVNSNDKTLVLKTTKPLEVGDNLTAVAVRSNAESPKASMDVIDNSSRLPKDIKQVRSDDQKKIKIQATPYQEFIGGAYTPVVPEGTMYELVNDKGEKIAGTEAVKAVNNVITFDVPKTSLTEGQEVFIKATEPNKDPVITSSVVAESSKPGTEISKGGKPSLRGVSVDITAPTTDTGVLPDINGFVGIPIGEKKVNFVEDNGINIIKRDGPNGTQLSIGDKNIGTISGTPQTQYNGETSVVVEDMFGNQNTIKGKATILGKIVDELPAGHEQDYYPVTFKSDEHSTLVVNSNEVGQVVKYILKDFNGDGQVKDEDQITLQVAKDNGLVLPEYKIKDNRYEIANPAWKPNIDEDGFKFGKEENNTIVLQTKETANIVPVENPTEKPIPDGFIRVTLTNDKSTVEDFTEPVKTYDVRKGANVTIGDITDKITPVAKEGFANPKWYNGDSEVVKHKFVDTLVEGKSGDDANKATLTAKAENSDKIIPVEDEKKATPEGYVRVTLKKGDKIISINGVTKYDIKKDGSVRYSDLINEITKEGSKTIIVIDDVLGREPFVWTLGTQDGAVVEPTAYPTEPTTLVVNATDHDATTYTPTPIEQTVKQGEKPEAKNSIANKDALPKDTKYEFVEENGNITTPDTSEVGTKDVRVKVTYPDKSFEIVKTKIKVVPKDELIDVKDPNSEIPDGYVRFKFADDASVKYPEKDRIYAVDVKIGSDARYADICNRAGATPAENYKEPIKWSRDKAEVKPEDKVLNGQEVAKSTVDLTPKATQVDASRYNPTPTVQKVVQDSTPEAKNSISNREEMPIGTTYKFVGDDGNTETTPNTKEVGTVPVKVLVTFPDNSTKVVETNIEVIPKDSIIDITDKPDTPNPEGYVKVTLVNDVTSVETFNKVYQVKADGSVRYSDIFAKAGSPQPKDGYRLPIVWKDGDSEVKPEAKPEEGKTIKAFATPTYATKIKTLDTQPQTVLKNEQPVPEKSVVKTDDYPEKTVFSYVGDNDQPLNEVDTSEVGTKEVTVKATFPDGSSLKGKADIKVQEKLEDIIPVPNPDDNPVPKDGYVRITLAKDNTVNFKDKAVTTYDVKTDAKVRYADVYSKVEATPADGYKDVKWYKADNSEVPAADIITKEETITAKATEVAKKEADIYEPKDKGITVKVGEKPAAKDTITFGEKDGHEITPPADMVVTWKTEPDTSKVTEEGKPATGVVEVIYNDGSREDVNVTVKVVAQDPNIIPVEDPSKPIPEGYARVTLAKDDSVNFKDKAVTTYDVKKDANIRYADVYSKVGATPADGYKDVKWYKADNSEVQAAGIITETETITAKATKVEAKKLADEYNASYTPISGQKGKEVVSGQPTFTNSKGQDAQKPDGTTFELPDAWKGKATIDENTGVVKYTIPAGETSPIVTIPVTVKYGDKSTEIANVQIAVQDPTKENSAAPTIDPVHENDKTVKVNVPKNTTGDITITFPGKDGNNIVVGPVNPNSDGTVTVNVPDNADMTAGKTITATYTEDGKNPTTGTTNIVKAPEVEKTTDPIIPYLPTDPEPTNGSDNKPIPQDYLTITFKAIPQGAGTVSVKGKEGETVLAKVKPGTNLADYITISYSAKEGYTAPANWKPALKEVNADETFVAEFTKNEQPAVPTITNPKAENEPGKDTTTVTGKTTPNTEVTITDKDGREIGKTTSDGDGNINVEITKQVPGTVITLTPNGGRSVDVTVIDKNIEPIRPIDRDYRDDSEGIRFNFFNFGSSKKVEDRLHYIFTIEKYEYKKVYNGVETEYKMDVTPVIQNDRTMLPLRYVAEAIGAEVMWNENTRVATFTKNGLTATIQIDDNKIVLSDGRIVEMDAKPLNINSRILVSVVNVGNVFGLTNGNTKDGIDQDIEWNALDRTATIYIKR